MTIIAQTFKKELNLIINSLNKSSLRQILCRQRLKFSKIDIINYVHVIFEHTYAQKRFKTLFKHHHQSWVKVNYSTFMNNVLLFSKLFKFLFDEINKRLKIKPSKLLNIVDTTLIEEKEERFINQKDWNSGRVTTRTKHDLKVRTCGSKGLIFMNRFGQVYYGSLLNINYSDQNILKDSAAYNSQLKGFLLADRGFSNKEVRKRINNKGTDIISLFNRSNQPVTRLISPYKKVEKKSLTENESRLYRRRWRIETLFQFLKDPYSNCKLTMKGKYHQQIKKAKFFTALIQFNILTTI